MKKELKKIKNRKLLLFIILPFMLTPLLAANNWENILPASTGSGFQYMREDLEDKISGNLGKLMAVIGFVGSFIGYIVSHKGSILMLGITISLIMGGFVGIVATFFNVGTSGF